MKKWFLILLISLTFLPLAVFAEDKKTPLTDFGSQNLDTAALGSDKTGYYSKQTDFNSFFGSIVSGILALAGTIFLVLTIYAGITWMTAAGNSDKIEKAKNILITAVIGGAITASAYAITYFVMGKIGTSSSSGNSSVYCCVTPNFSDGTKPQCSQSADAAACAALDPTGGAVVVKSCGECS